MTDRLKGVSVAFEKDIRDDDAEQAGRPPEGGNATPVLDPAKWVLLVEAKIGEYRQEGRTIPEESVVEADIATAYTFRWNDPGLRTRHWTPYGERRVYGLRSGARVLLTGQHDARANGLYVVRRGRWERVGEEGAATGGDGT